MTHQDKMRRHKGDPRALERVVIDLSTWTRLAEVDEYAHAHNITRAEAICRLVNSGLSHERR